MFNYRTEKYVSLFPRSNRRFSLKTLKKSLFFLHFEVFKIYLQNRFSFHTIFNLWKSFNGLMSHSTKELIKILSTFPLKSVFLNRCTLSRLNCASFRLFFPIKLDFFFKLGTHLQNIIMFNSFDILNSFKTEKVVRNINLKTQTAAIFWNFDLLINLGVNIQLI